MREIVKNQAADALVGYEELSKRRAEREPPSPPSPLPLGAAVCPYYKSHVCTCGGRGFCLDVA